jgi:hypothetical protein
MTKQQILNSQNEDKLNLQKRWRRERNKINEEMVEMKGIARIKVKQDNNITKEIKHIKIIIKNKNCEINKEK